MFEITHQGRDDQADRRVFVCYAREDSENVDKLQRKLEAAGLPVWRDRVELLPGEDWAARIRRAISENALVFIACFSRASLARDKSYQNEELTQAVEQMRLRRPDDTWLIPVRFDECDIPDLSIGAGRTLRSIHRADIFGEREQQDVERLVKSIQNMIDCTAGVSTIATIDYAAKLRQAPAAERGDHDVTGRRVRSRGETRHPKAVPSGIRQHATHRTLVAQARPHGASLDLDAIIVPGAPSAAHLDHAVTLARAADCWLLILCSRRMHQPEAIEFLTARSYDKAIVIDLPAGYSHELFRFRELHSIKNELPEACSFFTTDLSMKRNIALVLARMLQWNRIFFLDDDVRDITHPDLQATVNMLSSFSAAGPSVKNSRITRLSVTPIG